MSSFVLVSPTAQSSTRHSVTPFGSYPDLFSMLERRIDALRRLTGTIGEIMDGKLSAHSLGIVDDEQDCGQLRRQNDAGMREARAESGDADEICRVLEPLERAAAGLWAIVARLRCLHLAIDPDSRQMMAMIEQAIYVLNRSYRRWVKGSVAAKSDALMVMASTYRLLTHRSEGGGSASVCASLSIARDPATALASGQQPVKANVLLGEVMQVADEIAGATGFLQGLLQRLSVPEQLRTPAMVDVSSDLQPSGSVTGFGWMGSETYWVAEGRAHARPPEQQKPSFY